MSRDTGYISIDSYPGCYTSTPKAFITLHCAHGMSVLEINRIVEKLTPVIEEINEELLKNQTTNIPGDKK